MKKYLIIVLLILLFATIDHPSINQPRQKLLDEFISFIGEFSNVKTEQLSKQVFEKVSEHLTLSQNAQDYLRKQLSTSEKMNQFNTRYCVNKEPNNYFYGDDLRQICKIISQVKG